jgi:DNA uptake protein ComE-like DNA-binding protein
MANWQTWWRNVFGFSQSESRALLVLLPLMALLIVAVPAYQFWMVRTAPSTPPSVTLLDSLGVEPRNTPSQPEPQLFKFDPNTATREELIELGFKTQLADRLIRYREKNPIDQKEELRKLYGLSDAFYRQLEPYVVIPERENPGYAHRQIKPGSSKPIYDLNTADTVQLKSIYGVGPKLSQRIINYREKLGGYVSTDQLYEVYGLDSSVVDLLKMKFFVEPGFVPRKISINSAAEKNLSQHPYVGLVPGRLIMAYRFQHGAIRDWSELKTIRAIDTIKLKRALPYLEFGPN